MTQRKSVSKSQTCLGSFRLIEFPHSLVSGSFVAFRLATTAFSLWIFLAEHHLILCTLLNLLQMDAPFFSTLWVLHGAKRGLLKQHQQFGKTNKQTKKEHHNDSFRFIHPFVTTIILFQAHSYKGISWECRDSHHLHATRTTAENKAVADSLFWYW